MSLSTPSPSADLKAAWDKLVEDRGQLPLRMAADIIGTTEAQLLEARSGESIKRLTSDFGEILKEAQGLGQLMTLVRNDYFVTMPVGKFESLNIEGPHGRATGGPINIDFDLTGWGSAFSIVEESHGSLRRNIQFLDKSGDAVVKIVLWSKGSDDEFDRLIERFEDHSPKPLTIRGSADAGWMSFAEPENAVSISNNLSAKIQALFQVCVDEEVDIELRVPTRASAETYRGPIRDVEPRDEEGNWIDFRYPHFTSHFFVGQVSHGLAYDEDDTNNHVLTVVDKDNRVACTAKLPKGTNPAIDKAWSEAISTN